MTAETTNPPRRKKVWLRRTAVGLVASLILVELVLRMVLGLGSPLLYQADEHCQYLVKPDQHLYRFFAHNDINHYGMRSADFSMPRPKDRARFLFIGDSVTYGTTFVDQPRIFTSRLAAALPEIEHKPVDVLNASTGGWAIANELGYLRSRGTFDANAVLMVLNTFDFSQSVAVLSQPLHFPTERPWTALGETWQRYLLPHIGGNVEMEDPGTNLPTLDDELHTSELNIMLLDQAKDVCQKSGTVFGLIYVPFAGVQGPIVQRAQNGLADWARTRNVPFIDVSLALSREKADVLTFDGMHLRPHGNEVVATEIVKQWGIVDEAMAVAAATQKSQ